MEICKLFDKYRDKELGGADRGRFEAHLATCDECRTKMARLNNLVCVLNRDRVPQIDLSEQIARKAFAQGRSWDFLVVSWLRPGPAFATLALIFVLFSFLWLVPSLRRVNGNSEYEKLMDEADAIYISSSISEVRSDSDLVIWLQEEGNSR
jgi:predicted anti-sigma-YlaC factor YlaD